MSTPIEVTTVAIQRYIARFERLGLQYEATMVELDLIHACGSLRELQETLGDAKQLYEGLGYGPLYAHNESEHR